MTSPFLASQSDAPVLQVQGCMGGASLLPVSFQEGRRASDTSLTQGNAFLALLLKLHPPNSHWERGRVQGDMLPFSVTLRLDNWIFSLLCSRALREGGMPWGKVLRHRFSLPMEIFLLP